MRIILHAGLHKSGTTTVQAHWRAAYGRSGPVWYPSRTPNGRLRAHQRYFWPLLEAFTVKQPAELVWASTVSRDGLSLLTVIDEALGRHVQVLLMSTEELDRLRPVDVPRLQELLEGHEITTLFTVTRPLHRWCSTWQTLVKHGLAEYPRDGAVHVQTCGSLFPGRLEELVTLLPAHRRVVRLVRTSPHEGSLSEDLARMLDLSWPEDVTPLPAHNISLGTDVEILRRMNRADLTLGVLAGRGRQGLKRLKRSVSGYVEKPELAVAYQPPDEFWVAAEMERGFLVDRAGAAGVEVVDPHGELDQWTAAQAPEWYSEISRREAALPELDAPLELDELLWRVRQERYALRVHLKRAGREIAALRQELDELEQEDPYPERDSNPQALVGE